MLPPGATVLSVKAQVTSADASALLSVGTGGNTSRYMSDALNDAQSAGIYMSETFDADAGSVQVIATVSGTAGTAGAIAKVLVQYQVAQ
jgi:hypothetical protein